MYSVLYPDYLAKDDFKYEKPIADGICDLIKYEAKQANEIPDNIWNKADALVTGPFLKQQMRKNLRKILQKFFLNSMGFS